MLKLRMTKKGRLTRFGLWTMTAAFVVYGCTPVAIGLLLAGCNKGNVLEPTKREDVPMTPTNGPIVMTLAIKKKGVDPRVKDAKGDPVPTYDIEIGGNIGLGVSPQFDWDKEAIRTIEFYNYSNSVTEKKSVERHNGKPDMNADVTKATDMRAYGGKVMFSIRIDTELKDANRTFGQTRWHHLDPATVMLINADGVRDTVSLTKGPDGHPMLSTVLR